MSTRGQLFMKAAILSLTSLLINPESCGWRSETEISERGWCSLGFSHMEWKQHFGMTHQSLRSCVVLWRDLWLTHGWPTEITALQLAARFHNPGPWLGHAQKECSCRKISCAVYTLQFFLCFGFWKGLNYPSATGALYFWVGKQFYLALFRLRVNSAID